MDPAVAGRGRMRPRPPPSAVHSNRLGGLGRVLCRPAGLRPRGVGDVWLRSSNGGSGGSLLDLPIPPPDLVGAVVVRHGARDGGDGTARRDAEGPAAAWVPPVPSACACISKPTYVQGRCCLLLQRFGLSSEPRPPPWLAARLVHLRRPSRRPRAAPCRGALERRHAWQPLASVLPPLAEPDHQGRCCCRIPPFTNVLQRPGASLPIADSALSTRLPNRSIFSDGDATGEPPFQCSGEQTQICHVPVPQLTHSGEPEEEHALKVYPLLPMTSLAHGGAESY